MAFTFAKIMVTLRLQKNIRDRYFFFGLKNRFEVAFRNSVGCQSGDCSGCRSDIDCIARNIFSQRLAADPAAIKKYQKPSLPFVFHFPVIPDAPNKGVAVEVEIILIGQAAEHHGRFVQALCSAVGGTMSLVTAVSSDYGGNRYLLTDERGTAHADCLFLFSTDEIQKACALAAENIAVRVVTPMFLLRDGRSLQELCFSQFIRTLLRRVSSLAYYYGGMEMACDFKRLAEESIMIRTIQSSFSWTDWTGTDKGGKVAGITGRAVFAGDIESFYPFLLLGQYFNVGKGASYGRGRYVLD